MGAKVASAGKTIDEFANVSRPSRWSADCCELFVGNGLADHDAEFPSAVTIEFVHQKEHGKIEANAETFGPSGQTIEAIGIAPFEIDGHNVPLRLHTFRDKGFCPRNVLYFSVNAARTKAGGKHDDVLVAGESGTDALQQPTSFASGLVDGHDERRETGEVHQEVVGQIAHALIVMPAENGAEHHAVGTAEGMVRNKGEATTIGIRGQIFLPFDFDLQSQMANAVF